MAGKRSSSLHVEHDCRLSSSCQCVRHVSSNLPRIVAFADVSCLVRSTSNEPASQTKTMAVFGNGYAVFGDNRQVRLSVELEAAQSGIF